MTKLRRVDLSDGAKDLWFYCPGCLSEHPYRVGGNQGWQWNESMDSPTFSPSLLIPISPGRCHLFLKDGQIQFLDDCEHALRGQTVLCPDIEG